MTKRYTPLCFFFGAPTEAPGVLGQHGLALLVRTARLATLDRFLVRTARLATLDRLTASLHTAEFLPLPALLVENIPQSEQNVPEISVIQNCTTLLGVWRTERVGKGRFGSDGSGQACSCALFCQRRVSGRCSQMPWKQRNTVSEVRPTGERGVLLPRWVSRRPDNCTGAVVPIPLPWNCTPSTPFPTAPVRYSSVPLSQKSQDLCSDRCSRLGR